MPRRSRAWQLQERLDAALTSLTDQHEKTPIGVATVLLGETLRHIAAHGASVRLPELRSVMASRNELWFEILERGLEGIVPRTGREKVPYAWQLDALMNGLVIQAITTEANISFKDIEHAVVSTALEHGHLLSDGKVDSKTGSWRRPAARR